ncbi:MAG: T9SS type A sorting domain-containing protein [Bacteroidales bacterium]|nr:T9SS type A sorting domain-containing protein [Bacteroidales bacterium]
MYNRKPLFHGGTFFIQCVIFVVMTCFTWVHSLAQLSGVKTVGSGGDYTSFTNAGGAFQAISSGTLDGNLVLEVISDITGETGAYSLMQWAEIGSGNYTVTICPDGNTERLIEGNYQGTGYNNEGLYRFDGVSRVIVDGRDPANLSVGGRYLRFRNTNSAGTYYQSTFTFLNGSYEDTLRYVIAEGAAYMYSVGIVRFGRYLQGNHDILVDNCQIRDLSTTGAATGSGIYSYGVSAAEPNYNITITNNEIFNIWRGNTDNAGVYVTNYNEDWNISGNHIYLNGAKSATGNCMKYGIYLSNTGEDMVVSGNYIGGSQPFCGGTPWVYSMSGDRNTRFCGIYIDPNDPSYSYLIENNTIQNIEWKQSYYSTTSDVVPFTGIHSAYGNNTISGNCIGESTGTESILVYCGAAAQLSTGYDPLYSYGIIVECGNVLIENNTIGSIKFVPYDAADDAALEFIGIYISDTEPGGGDNVDSAMVKGNTIGSETTALSIETTAPSVFNGDQAVSGIYLGSYGVNIARNNIIANMHNGNNFYYSHSNTYGIYTNYNGKKLIVNNRIFSLSNNTYHTQVDYGSSVVGIKYYSSTNTTDSIIDNEIYDLRNTTSNTRKVGVCGIGITATTKSSPGSVEVARNIIHSFDVSTTEDYAVLTGIHFYAVRINVYNNFIRLGIDKDGNSVDKNLIITGIKQSSNNCVVDYNTVFIGGTVAGGDTSSWAFRRTTAGWSAPQSTDLYNNIFLNERNNSSAVNTHFSVGFQMEDSYNPVEEYITELNSDYNLFYSTSGTVAETGVGEFITLGDWQAYFGKDLNSISGDVNFVDDTGPAASVDLHIDTSLPTIVESAGTVIAGIGDDIDLELRFGTPGNTSTGTAPDVGADEINFSPLPVALLSFYAVCDNGSVHLYWATATEINNDYFIIEYSSNLEDWQEIALVSGAGTSLVMHEYSALHIPYNSMNYYRLSQVDFDGSVTQYDPVSCLCDNSEASSILVYPNPLNDVLFISMDEVNAQLIIVDHLGRVVYSDKISEQQTSIDLSPLPAGQYILKVISQSKTETIKIQKL